MTLNEPEPGWRAHLAAARAALARARSVCVLSGAGMSAESGLATFRAAQTGLWSRFRPEDLATPEAYFADPPLVWAWYEWRRLAIVQAQPNAGHRALADWGQRRFATAGLTLLTQNVDDLHERAGSTDVVHLHGRLDAARCAHCGAAYAHAGAPAMPLAELASGHARLPPPRCSACGGPVRPGVVWFGEALPAAALARAEQAAEQCEAMLVIGTSGLVYPAAALPSLAARRGAVLIQVNPEASMLDGQCAFNLRGPASEVLPALLLDQD